MSPMLASVALTTQSAEVSIIEGESSALKFVVGRHKRPHMVDVDGGGRLALLEALLAERMLSNVGSAQPLPPLRLVY